jgi:hypothetical protein
MVPRAAPVILRPGKPPAAAGLVLAVTLRSAHSPAVSTAGRPVGASDKSNCRVGMTQDRTWQPSRATDRSNLFLAAIVRAVTE